MNTTKFITNELDSLDSYERGEFNYNLDKQGWCYPIIKKILNEFKELTFVSFENVDYTGLGVGYVVIVFFGVADSYDKLQKLANELFEEDENTQPDPIIREFSEMTIFFYTFQV